MVESICETIIKMQEVKFADVNEFLDFLPEDELQITLQLRNIILECIHGVKERLAYNVPYYKRHKIFALYGPHLFCGERRKVIRVCD